MPPWPDKPIHMGTLRPESPLPHLTVIIPSWNGRKLLETCLDALEKAYQKTGLPDAIIIVDNGSEDGTVEWIQAKNNPRLSCVPLEKNHGFAFACNRGVEQATSEWVLILNNDTIPAPHFAEKLLRAATKENASGNHIICAPVSNYVKGQQLIPLLEGEDEQSVELIEKRLTEAAEGIIEDVLELSGLCLVLRRQSYLTLGGFDERYGLGNYEDDDLCFKARRQGGRLLIARDAYVHHLGNRTFMALGMDYEKNLKEKQNLFFDKWNGDELFILEGQSLNLSPQEFLPIVEEARLPSTCTPWLRRLQAKAYEGVGLPAKALWAWREFLALCSKNTEARSKEALLLFQLGRTQEARLTLSHALEECWFGPIFAASVLTQVANLLRKEAGDEAADYLGFALEICPDFIPALNLRAVWAIEEGRFREAENILLPFQQREDADLWNNLGIAMYQQGKGQEAREAFARAAQKAGPGSPGARNLAALGG